MVFSLLTTKPALQPVASRILIIYDWALGNSGNGSLSAVVKNEIV